MAAWRIGAVTVTKIVESEQEGIDASEMLMPLARPEVVAKIDWLQPHFADPAGKLKMSFHAFVVQTPSRTIVVDTCVGNDKERGIPPLDNLKTAFMEDFEAAGFRREAVDVVVCTHLHIDHVGWNTMKVGGKWVPTFPKARFLIGREEFEHWRTQEGDAFHRAVFEDSMQPVWDAGQVDLVAADHRICDEVRLVPTPGHTPGHVSVLIESEGQSALITGDFIHHPCQLAHPEWSTSFDSDPACGIDTRKRKFAELAGSPVLVIGTHFSPPTTGHVVRDGKAFKLVM